MHPLLSRIEREYVIESLRDDLPELTVLSGGVVNTITNYRCTGKLLSWDKTDTSGVFVSGPAKIVFSHRKRAMSFRTELVVSPQNISCTIAQEIGPEDQSSDSSLRIQCPGLTGIRYAVYPHVHVPLSRKDLRDSEEKEHYCALGQKAGIDTNDFPALLQLAKYLEDLGNGSIPSPSEHGYGHIVHCDHRLAVLAFPLVQTETVSAGDSVPIRITAGQRSISVTGLCRGSITVTSVSGIINIHLETIQEEDKRFLFEQCYLEKYTGNE